MLNETLLSLLPNTKIKLESKMSVVSVLVVRSKNEMKIRVNSRLARTKWITYHIANNIIYGGSYEKENITPVFYWGNSQYDRNCSAEVFI